MRKENSKFIKELRAILNIRKEEQRKFKEWKLSRSYINKMQAYSKEN